MTYFYLSHIVGLAILSGREEHTIIPLCVLAISALILLVRLRKKEVAACPLRLGPIAIVIGQCGLSAVLLVVAGLKYYSLGIPWFAADPDIARMTFVSEGGFPVKCLITIGPFVILLHMLYVRMCHGLLKWMNIVTCLLVCFEYVLLGSKSQMAMIVFLFMWSGYAMGEIGNTLKIIGYGLVIVPAIIVNFILVLGAAATEAIGQVLARASYLQAQGILIAFADPDLGPSDFWVSITNIVERLKGHVPYSVGLSNIVTAKYYQRDVYDTPFTLTITAYSDFYILAGLLGCAFVVVLVPYTSHRLIRAAFSSGRPTLRVFYLGLFHPLINCIFKGGVAGVVWGEVMPYVVFASAYTVVSCLVWKHAQADCPTMNVEA